MVDLMAATGSSPGSKKPLLGGSHWIKMLGDVLSDVTVEQFIAYLPTDVTDAMRNYLNAASVEELLEAYYQHDFDARELYSSLTDEQQQALRAYILQNRVDEFSGALFDCGSTQITIIAALLDDLLQVTKPKASSKRAREVIARLDGDQKKFLYDALMDWHRDPDVRAASRQCRFMDS